MRVFWLLAVMFVFSAASAQAVDDRAAKGLAKDSDCFKCHSVSKQKDGPPYKEIAKKYKDDPTALEKLMKHATTTPMVKIDGKEEKHGRVKSDDPEEIKNLVQWILSQ